MLTRAIVTLAALALLAVPAVLVPAMLPVRGRAPFLVASGVTAAAVIVGVSLVLSVFDALTRGGLLAAQALVAVICAMFWLRRGRPAAPRLHLRSVIGRNARSGTSAVVLVAAAALAVQFYVAITVAPNNWDSMTYHLSRAAYWLQYQSVGAFPGGSVRQLDSAPNGEILQAWTMAITGTDRFASLVQWAALLGTALCVFSGARLLRAAPAAAALAASVFVILPQPIMQATSTQNDLIVAFFVVACALFTVRGIRDRHVADLAVAAAAAGLALGTKGTALFAVPSLALITIGALVCYRPGRRLTLVGAGLLIAGLLAFGSFSYLSNLERTGDAFGGLEAQTKVPEGVAVTKNVAWVTWSLVDAPGTSVPVVEMLLQRAGHALWPDLRSETFNWTIDASIHEDTSSFGLVGWLVLMPLVVFCLLRRRAPPAQRILAGAALLYLGLFATRIGFNPWVGRLMIPMIALVAPLLALVVDRAWLHGATLTLAVLSLLPVLLHNSAKTLLPPEGTPWAPAKNRVQQQTVNRPDMAPVLRWMQANVHGTAPIGFAGGEDDWDYPLFGAHRSRRVVRLGALGADPQATLRKQGIVGVLFVNTPVPADLVGTTVAPGYAWVAVKS